MELYPDRGKIKLKMKNMEIKTNKQKTCRTLCIWRVRFAAPVTLQAEDRWAEPPVGWRRAAPPSADRDEPPRQAPAQSGNSNRTQQHTRSHADIHTHTRTHTYRRIIVLQGQRGRQCARDTYTRLHSTKVTCYFLFLSFFFKRQGHFVLSGGR